MYMRNFFIFLSLTIVLAIFGTETYKYVVLDQQCTGYLKRAADANTVETAKKQLEISLNYLESHNMTKGYTSIIYNTPDEDVSFFYNNLKASLDELNQVNANTSNLEKTNMLMKLRETIIDNGKTGDTLTLPNGLFRYPNNLLWLVLNIIGGFFLFVAFVSFSTPTSTSTKRIINKSSFQSRLEKQMNERMNRK